LANKLTVNTPSLNAGDYRFNIIADVKVSSGATKLHIVSKIAGTTIREELTLGPATSGEYHIYHWTGVITGVTSGIKALDVDFARGAGSGTAYIKNLQIMFSRIS
jgi:hypothetical protein